MSDPGGEKYTARYAKITEKASDVLRQLAFGGLAVVWIFRNQADEIRGPFIFAALMIVIYFILDVAQYYLTALTYESAMACSDSNETPEVRLKRIEKRARRMFKVKGCVLLAGLLVLVVQSGRLLIAGD